MNTAVNTAKLYTIVVDFKGQLHTIDFNNQPVLKDKIENTLNLNSIHDADLKVKSLTFNKKGYTLNFDCLTVVSFLSDIHDTFLKLNRVSDALYLNNIDSYSIIKKALNDENRKVYYINTISNTFRIIAVHHSYNSPNDLLDQNENCLKVPFFVSAPIDAILNAYNEHKRTIQNSYKIYSHHLTEIERINTLIRYYSKCNPSLDLYKKPVQQIPECLKGNFGLIGITLFLQVTDKMKHSGFVFTDNKLHCVLNRQVGQSNQLIYVLQGKYKNMSYSKNWIKTYNSEIYVPYDYAYNAGIECYINDEEESTTDLSDLSFSHSCGYYNDDKTVHDGQLYDSEEIVTLYNGETCHIDDAYWVESENEYYPDDEVVIDIHGTCILSDNSIRYLGHYYSIHDNEVSTCCSCDDHFHIDQLTYSEQNDGNYCEECYEEESNDCLNRMDYSENVLDHKGFGTTDLYINKKPVYVGLELECLADSYDSDIESINSFIADTDYCIACKDGSLDDSYGVEFIFRPEGLKQQKSNVADLIYQIGHNVNNKTFDSYDDNYGLHVHISSHFLGKATKLKIQNFVNIHFDEFIGFIGGREATTFQRYKSERFNKLDTQRYNFVNILNSATIEYRFPAGVVNEEHINVNLELAQALTLYCKFELSLLLLRSNANTAMMNFIEWVNNHSDDYPLLTVVLNDKAKCKLISEAA